MTFLMWAIFVVPLFFLATFTGFGVHEAYLRYGFAWSVLLSPVVFFVGVQVTGLIYGLIAGILQLLVDAGWFD